MEFRILGPLEVTDGDRTIEIPAPKQRLLVTVLALAAGGVVSSDRLLQELWGENPPGGSGSRRVFRSPFSRKTLSSAIASCCVPSSPG